MRKTSPGFFRRHKTLVLAIVLLALLLTWFHWPRPLLTGRDLRLAQNEAATKLRGWRYTDGKQVDVTDRIDRAGLIDRLSRTRCIRYFGDPDSVSGADMRYEVCIALGGRALCLRLGVPAPYSSTNCAYYIGRGLHVVWRVLDYEALIADLDEMLNAE